MQTKEPAAERDTRQALQVGIRSQGEFAELRNPVPRSMVTAKRQARRSLIEKSRWNKIFQLPFQNPLNGGRVPLLTAPWFDAALVQNGGDGAGPLPLSATKTVKGFYGLENFPFGGIVLAVELRTFALAGGGGLGVPSVAKLANQIGLFQLGEDTLNLNHGLQHWIFGNVGGDILTSGAIDQINPQVGEFRE